MMELGCRPCLVLSLAAEAAEVMARQLPSEGGTVGDLGNKSLDTWYSQKVPNKACYPGFRLDCPTSDGT